MAAINLSLSLSCWLAPKWMDQRAAATRDEGQTGDATAARPIHSRWPAALFHLPSFFFEFLLHMYMHQRFITSHLFQYVRGTFFRRNGTGASAILSSRHPQQITKKKKSKNKKLQNDDDFFQSVCNL